MTARDRAEARWLQRTLEAHVAASGEARERLLHKIRGWRKILWYLTSGYYGRREHDAWKKALDELGEAINRHRELLREEAKEAKR